MAGCSDVCKMQTLKVNVTKSITLVFEKGGLSQCNVSLTGEKLEFSKLL